MRQGIARLVTARHYDKAAVVGPDVGELPGDVDARPRVHAPVHHLVVLADGGRVGVPRVQHLPARAFDVAQGRALSHLVPWSDHPVQAPDDGGVRQHLEERLIVRRRQLEQTLQVRPGRARDRRRPGDVGKRHVPALVACAPVHQAVEVGVDARQEPHRPNHRP